MIAEIVAKMPKAVEKFFRRVEVARDRLLLPLVAETLNHSEVEEEWYEILRDLFILKRQGPRLETDVVRKDPRAFATFARTAEPTFLKSEFWFGAGGDLRFEFERYLYSRTDGGVWGAVDWEMDLYLQTRIYAALKSDETLVLKRIAALALSVRAIAAGELGIYLEERNDVNLPLAGVTNEVGSAPLLDYYHYDRFTHLSFARAGEGHESIRFEPRWLALAVLSDVILKEADARSTLASARRIALESLAQATLRIKRKLSPETSHLKVRLAAEKLYELVTETPERLASLSEAEVVSLVGCDAKLLARRSLVPKAETFWKIALPHFEKLDETYARRYRELAIVDTDDDETGEDEVVCYVRETLLGGKTNELLGEVGRVPLREALKKLIASGEIAIEPKTLSSILFDENSSQRFRVKIGRRICELPPSLPFDASAVSERRAWVVGVLEAMSAADSRERGGKPIVYRRVEWMKVREAADKLWNFYFTEDKICRGRWIVSIARALEILDEAERKNYASYPITPTFNWPCRAVPRLGLKTRLLAEKAKFTEAGLWPSDLNALKEELKFSPSITIDDVLSGEGRLLVMVMILARLKARTRRELPELWASREDLFGLFTHLLIASNQDFDLPFPWHLDITSGSYLRIGRTHARQTNVVDALVEERFHDSSEELLYQAFLAYEG